MEFKTLVVISDEFEKSFKRIIDNLSKASAVRLGRAIDKLIQILAYFPESFPLIIFPKPIEIPYRKAVIAKKFIVIYLYQFEKVYVIDFFYTAENWQQKLLN
jgi:hypothetical protein